MASYVPACCTCSCNGTTRAFYIPVISGALSEVIRAIFIGECLQMAHGLAEGSLARPRTFSSSAAQSACAPARSRAAVVSE